MSVYRRGEIFYYEFVYRGLRHGPKSTGQTVREHAEAVERIAKDRARQAAHGILIEPPHSPSFQDWAEIYLDHAAKRVTRPTRIEYLLRGLLRFWGRRPDDPAKVHEGAPYHDLTLLDPINDPGWMLKWERWLEEAKPIPNGRGERPWSGQTRNQHRSALSEMFALASKPEWRKETNVDRNPCLGAERDRRVRRMVALTREDVEAILAAASWHLRLAMAIALLAPKLRLDNILKLRFRDVSDERTWLSIHQHKTAAETGAPMIAYLSTQLREILTAAKLRARAKDDDYIVTYHGQPVRQLRGAVLGAVTRAAVGRPHLAYGRDRVDGITFHSMRHTAATRLLELHVPLVEARDVMGHLHIDTTLWYAHLRPTHEVAPTELLSQHTPIRDLVLNPRSRGAKAAGIPVGTDAGATSKTRGKAETDPNADEREKSA